MRRSAASRYRELISAMGNDKVSVSCEPEWSRCVYHLFVVRVENRDELIKQLASTVWHGNSLSDSPPPSECLRRPRVQDRRFSHHRKSRCGDPLSAYVPALRGDQQSGVVRELTKFVATEGPSLMEPKIA